MTDLFNWLYALQEWEMWLVIGASQAVCIAGIYFAWKYVG